LAEKWGLLSMAAIGPHLTQCAWAEAYLRTKWHLDPSNGLSVAYRSPFDHVRYRQIGQTGQYNGPHKRIRNFW